MDNIYKTIPDQISGWKADGEDIVYDRETLFDYMDGGAEVYLAFDFQDVFVRRYTAESGDEIVLDIYDMGSPAEAFGVFSCDREDEEAGIGQGSEYGYGMLRFWKGRYFVTIVTSGEYQVAEGAILDLGRAVDGILGPEGEEPEMLSGLPREGLLRDRVSYFHSSVNLNNRYYFASENILDLDRDTDCVFAEYESGGSETVKLLVVRYPDEQRAESVASGLAAIEDPVWLTWLLDAEIISIVFGAPDEETASRLQRSIHF